MQEIIMIRFSSCMVAIFLISISAHAAGDPVKGEQIFKKCAICHSVGPDAKNKIGPVLNGIVGRKWGAMTDFAYSNDIKAGATDGKVWDEQTLDAYLTNPKKLAPKGKMVFPGLSNPQDRADVISYLNQFDDTGGKK
jgi:cytochrome c